MISQRLAAVERHHAGIAERDRALRSAGIGVLADRDQPVALDQRAGRSRSDRRRESRAPRAPRLSSTARAGARMSRPRSAAYRRTRPADRRRRARSPRAPPAPHARCRAARAERRSRRPGAAAWPRRRQPRGRVRSPRPARRPAPSGAAPSTCASSDWPATGCSTLGSEERMRVPSPAASTMVRLVLPVIPVPESLAASVCAAAVIKCFEPEWKPGCCPKRGCEDAGAFPVNVCRVIRRGSGGPKSRMAKDSDNLAGSFETEDTGGLLTGFLAEEDQFDRRSLWRLGSWGVGAVGAVVVAVLANQSSIASAARADRRRRSGAAGAADPVGRQGKPGRDPAAGLRHRDPQWRSRPAVLPHHRAGTGPGFGDRRDRAAKSCRGVRRRLLRNRPIGLLKCLCASHPRRVVLDASASPVPDHDLRSAPSRHHRPAPRRRYGRHPKAGRR